MMIRKHLITDQFRAVAIMVFSVLVLVSGCATTTPQLDDLSAETIEQESTAGQTVAKTDTTVIVPGDSIAFYVWDYAEFTSRCVVNGGGYVTLSILGEERVAGLTKPELEAQIRQKLSTFVKNDPKIFIDITKPPMLVTILGAVTRSGSYPAVSDLRLLQVLAQAGGWTERADLRYVRIHRQGPKGVRRSYDVDLQSAMETGRVLELPMVKPGDVVIVQEQENFVRQFSSFIGDAIFIFGIFRIANY
jgi:polysaccharide export outer membrane protein